MVNEAILSGANHLISLAGFSSNEILDIQKIHGGGNNQIYLINHPAGPFVLKKYFQHPNDSRNRLLTEFNFFKMAHLTVPQYVPQFFVKDESLQLALYEYIQGEKIVSAEELNSDLIGQAANFIVQLNRLKKQAIDVAPAAEACFSICDHMHSVDNRLEQLNQITGADSSFINLLSDINNQWRLISNETLRMSAHYNINPSDAIDQSQRVLSPSDFGFHNVLRKKNGSLVFVDFEYAGWDDPAKLVGDFFAQVAIPVHHQHLDTFLNVLFPPGDIPKNIALRNRSRLLINLYKIKWCCIVLNVFIPENFQRRQFAQHQLDTASFLSGQILKAKNLLNRINHGLY